ncbi:MAG: glycosyltransferase [Candidatus Paceibacterota bacterium]
MKENLILLTSTFPFGTGETFLETELPHIAQAFSQVIILPTKSANTVNPRLIPNNCIINTSIISKLNKESSFERIISKLVITFTTSFFLKEFINIFPNRISLKVIDNLLTHSRDAILSKKAIEQISKSNKFSTETTLTYSYWCTGATFGATLAKPKYPVISRVHRGDLYEELYSKNYIPFRKKTIANVDKIFSISENGINYLTKRYRQYSSKFQLSRLGIPIPDAISYTQHQEAYPLIVVSCSSINKNKRVESIADSLKNFARKFPNVQLTWNHFGDGPQLDRLNRIVDEFPKNLSGVLHGRVENKELMKWYSKSTVHLFINLSRSEGIPVSIMEAYSYGIPAIATQVGGTSELVTDENGWLVNRDFTSKEILAALEEALLNHSLRINKSKKAHDTCLIYFDSKKNYPEFAKKLKTLGKTAVKNKAYQK